MFEKYIHLERFGTDEVDGINVGDCHIFPKLDGTNASAWMCGPEIKCGSRNLELSLDDDNAGFMNWVIHSNEAIRLRAMLRANPDLRLFGEWLVPHSLKTYREDAWRKFYVFDVMDLDGNFLHYDEYSQLCKLHEVDFIPCTLKSHSPTYEILQRAIEDNRFLIQDGQGHGEGVVIKQYGWKNRFGRTTWAKLITNTFKDKHIQEMGGSVANAKLVEEEIADEFITSHMVEKIVAKIRVSKGKEASFGARDIPQLLGMAYHDLVTEELWQAIKAHKQPKICFKTLNHCAIAKVKKLKPELFVLAAA